MHSHSPGHFQSRASSDQARRSARSRDTRGQSLSWQYNASMSSPTVCRVVYDLFEFEASVLDEPGSSEVHRLDREIRFEMSDGSCWFASWTNAPVQYSVGFRKESFFLPGDCVARDVSNHPLWADLVGKAIEFVVIDGAHQVVEVRSPSASVFLSSQENGQWEMDVLTVSRLRPSGINPIRSR